MRGQVVPSTGPPDGAETAATRPEAARVLATARKTLALSATSVASEIAFEETILQSDNTPHLHSKLTDRRLWHVVVRDWRLRLPSAEGKASDRFDRVVDLYLDPDDGRLLKLRSRWPDSEPGIRPEPSADVAEDQFFRAGRERYDGFPDEEPTVKLIDALDSMYRSGYDPYEAKQILAQCVVRSTRYKEPKPVWAITLRGVHPIRVPPGWPADDRYEYRVIVDARTGIVESISNRPRAQEGVPPDPGK